MTHHHEYVYAIVRDSPLTPGLACHCGATSYDQGDTWDMEHNGSMLKHFPYDTYDSWLHQERLDAQGKREVNLWHPDSPGTRVWVRPGFWRRTGINRSPFATLSEMSNMDKRREQR